jgi:UDP-galactopyranose mutase
MRFDVLVAGAGLAGSVAARVLAEKGKKVLVVERSRHVAGHCHDYRNDSGITVHSYGPHIFHTKEKAVWDFVRRFSGFTDYQHRVLSYAEGGLFPFPINRDTVCKAFGIDIDVGRVADFLKAEAAKAGAPERPANYRDAIVSQVGQRFYDLFFRNYTAKQWGRAPEELSAELANRIPVRTNRDDRYFSDPYQGMPAGGYTRMVESILDHANIALMLGADYLSVKDGLDAGLTVYTGELDRFFGYKHGELEYRSLELEFRTLDAPRYQEAAVVNYPNDYDWTRITEFKLLTGEKSDRTTICLEYPKAKGEPYYVVPDAANLKKRGLYMDEAAELERSGKWLFVGRLAEYAYYNMDQVIKAALDKASKVP